MLALALPGLLAYAAIVVTCWVVQRRAAAAVRAADTPVEHPAAPTGGELARSMLEDAGMDVVEVQSGDVDAYLAIPRVVQLGEGRAERASIAAWAVAAHEVAHAQLHRSADPSWRRWWVLSGHASWAVILLPVLLVMQLGIRFPILSLLVLAVAVIPAISGWLSSATERKAVQIAWQRLQDAGDLSDEQRAAAARVLEATAAGYVAESIVDVGALTRRLRRR